MSNNDLISDDTFEDVDVEPIKGTPPPNEKVNSTEPKPIVICLPGKSFSSDFLQSYTGLLTLLSQNNIPFVVSIAYDPNIYFCRNKILGANILRGKDQKPFDEQLDYSHLLWIDSDIIFSQQDIQNLFMHAQEHDFVSGLYAMSDGRHFAAVEQIDNDFLKANGSFKFITEDVIRSKQEPFPVAYTGLGFCMMKRGIMESLQYPWFRPKYLQLEGINDIVSEDAALCFNLANKGIIPYVCPDIIVGHQKDLIIGVNRAQQSNSQDNSDLDKVLIDDIDDVEVSDFSEPTEF